MTPSEVFAKYAACFSGWSWRDGPSHADSYAYEVGSHSVWSEDGMWRVGVESGLKYSHASGWDGGVVAELPAADGGGPHSDFEPALRAAIKAEVEMRLTQASETVSDVRRWELCQVVEVHDS